MNAYREFHFAGVLNAIVHLMWGCAYWELLAHSKETKKIIYMAILCGVLLVASAYTESMRDNAKIEYDKEKRTQTTD